MIRQELHADEPHKRSSSRRNSGTLSVDVGVGYERRGRRSSSTSSSASAARTSVYLPGQTPGQAPGQGHTQAQAHRGSNSSTDGGVPTKFPPPITSADVYDAMEREQEAMVNRLQREIATLKTDRARSRSRSQSESSTSSLSRNPSIRSTSEYESSDLSLAGRSQNSATTPSLSPVVSSVPTGSRSPRTSFSNPGGYNWHDDSATITALRKENEALKTKLGDFSIRLAEKENEIDQLRRRLGDGR